MPRLRLTSTGDVFQLIGDLALARRAMTEAMLTGSTGASVTDSDGREVTTGAAHRIAHIGWGRELRPDCMCPPCIARRAAEEG